MSAHRHPAPDSPPAPPLDPGLLAVIEALARAHADEDYAAAAERQKEPT